MKNEKFFIRNLIPFSWNCYQCQHISHYLCQRLVGVLRNPSPSIEFRNESCEKTFHIQFEFWEIFLLFNRKKKKKNRKLKRFLSSSSFQNMSTYSTTTRSIHSTFLFTSAMSENVRNKILLTADWQKKVQKLIHLILCVPFGRPSQHEVRITLFFKFCSSIFFRKRDAHKYTFEGK